MTSTESGVHNLKSMAEYKEQVIDAGGVALIDAYAVWCGPCKMIAPKIVELSNEMPNVRFYKVDVDEVPDVAQELNITAMPTFLVFKDGEIAEQVVGANINAVRNAVTKAV